jgi:hypothetical protein
LQFLVLFRCEDGMMGALLALYNGGGSSNYMAPS